MSTIINKNVYVVNVVYLVNVVYVVNVTKVRFTRFTRYTHYIPGGLVNLGVNLALIGLPLTSMRMPYPCHRGGFPGSQGGKVVKLARFKHESGVKIGRKAIKNSLINYLLGYGNYTYHNHETQDPHFLRNIHYLQMINDLQRHFENADNFLLV